MVQSNYPLMSHSDVTCHFSVKKRLDARGILFFKIFLFRLLLINEVMPASSMKVLLLISIDCQRWKDCHHGGSFLVFMLVERPADQ